MQLKTFIYVDTKLLDELQTGISGSQTDELTVVKKATSETCSTVTEELVGSVNSLTPAAKFNILHEYLHQVEKISTYKQIDEVIYANLNSGEFFEAFVSPRFSKLKSITDTSKNLSGMVDFLSAWQNTDLSGDKKNLDTMSNLGSSVIGGKYDCAFTFPNNKYTLVGTLFESNFDENFDDFTDGYYVLCKVKRVIKKGEKKRLDDVLSKLTQASIPREQQRKMKKNNNSLKPVQDIINGPAIEVIVIGIYI